MAKRGCVLTDEQLQDLYLVMKDFDEDFEDAEFIFTEWREDIVSALYELQQRRATPDLPDADDLLGIEADAQEAIDDALADTRPMPPYEHHDKPDYEPPKDWNDDLFDPRW